MTKVTSRSGCAEHGPYLLVLGREAPATGLQPPVVVAHVLPDLPVLLPLLLTASRGCAVTEETNTAAVTQLMVRESSWGWRECGQYREEHAQQTKSSCENRCRESRDRETPLRSRHRQFWSVTWAIWQGKSLSSPLMMFQEPFRNRE